MLNFLKKKYSFAKKDVGIKNGTPHCKKHGAMNKYSKDIWKCLVDETCVSICLQNK